MASPVKKDKRKGIKPTAELAKQVKRLFATHTIRELSAKLTTHYITLKNVERPQPVMAHKISEL